MLLKRRPGWALPRVLTVVVHDSIMELPSPQRDSSLLSERPREMSLLPPGELSSSVPSNLIGGSSQDIEETRRGCDLT